MTVAGRDRLDATQRRFLVLLGFPALGLTFAVTVVVTYLPVRLAAHSGPLLIGTIVGGEGLFALFMPAVVGTWSDRVSRTVAGRLAFLLVAAPVAAVSVLLMGLLPSVAATAAVVAVFYLAYYTYLAPYWALYPDLVPTEHAGRSRGAEGSWRVTGSGLATMTGGFLLACWTPLPFLVAALGLLAVTALLWWGLGAKREEDLPDRDGSTEGTWGQLRSVVAGSADVRRLLLANALWNFSLSALRAFVVLFFTTGLGRSVTFVSGVIFPLAALGFVAVPVSGKLADRFDAVRVLRVAVAVYGVGLLVPWLTHSSGALLAIPVVSAAAATVMTLPFAQLMQLLGDEGSGAASGLFGMSRGVGSLLGPVVVGAAVELLHGVPTFSDTRGFDALWLLIGLSTLASLPLVLRIRTDPSP